MKILIAVPTYESIQPETFKSIYGLDKCGHWCVFDYSMGYDVATARNNIGNQAKAEGADYVLMVDNDVRLPGDALRNLLEDPVDVCLGYYAHRWGNVFDGRTNVCRLGEYNYTDMYSAEEVRALRDAGVKREQVHGGGLGCALVRTDVFERIPFPYFQWTHYQDGNVLGEDLNFCERCGERGIKIHVDPRVACGHLFRRYEEVM